MPILTATGLRKSFGDRDVLAGVSLTVDAGERIGVVGRNGSGKSTFARILAGLEDADEGAVARQRDLRLGYLAQEPALPVGATALQAVLEGLAEWTRAVERHRVVSEALGQPGVELEALLAEQSALAATVERLGGWQLSHEASSVLGHLGIADATAPIDSMSGGERRRVAMARLLVARPDVALLDEPTNHLDVDTIEWLETYLVERFTGALLLVTHDRYLLDRVVTRTIELENGALFSYDGGWESYLTARAERHERAEQTEANRQNFLRRELEWLRRQPKARTGKQKARIDRAHAVLDSGPTRASGTARIALSQTRSGKQVLEVHDLAVEIAGKRLIDGLELSLGAGERIGIVGRNGSGKTTLVRVLLGELAPARGEVVLGKNTKIAYLDQRRSGLDDAATVYDNVAEGRVNVQLGAQELTVLAYLERFLFSREKQQQKVGSLSGGERARVALARILREGSNLVILDEPTNDLDVMTLAALEESLMDFGGTVLVVTHDRWFLDRVATSVLGLENGESGKPHALRVHGGYSDFVRHRDELRAAQRPQPVVATPQNPPSAPKHRKALTYGEELELEGLMERVMAAEADVAVLEATIGSPSFADLPHGDQARVAAELEAARVAAEALVERWAELEARQQDAT